jgi:glutaminyl-peptide cyclotransferase
MPISESTRQLFLRSAALVLVLLTPVSLFGRPLPASGATFQGTAALAYTRRATSFGERPSGSEAIIHTRDWIVSELKPLGGQIELDSFTGQTPAGPVPMVNVLFRFPGVSGKSVVVSGHYDTKKIPMVHFVGANDGGSSTGFLIEFARVVSRMQHADDIIVVFFDGEEAVGTWTDSDSCYGSRHLVAKWASDGTLARIKALINIDMVGDKNLDLSNDGNSSESLRAQLRKIAERLGHAASLRTDEGAIEDDHKPFANSGVNVIDIIDLDYGPQSAYWHTAQDAMDKLSAQSLQTVGDLVVQLIRELEQKT